MDQDYTEDKLQINLQKLTPFENFYTGVVSGCIEVACMQPVLFLKNASQQSRGFTLNPKVLYRGVTVSMVNMGVLTGIQFPLTNFVTKMITGDVERRLSNNEMILSGLLGGMMSSLLCAPMELVLIQQQNTGSHLIETPKGIIKNFGATSLMRGLVGTCAREGMWCCGYMGLGPVAHRSLKETYGMENGRALLLGSILSGVIVATLSHPMDTVKTCMQGDLEQIKYKGFMATTNTLYREGGITRFFWGWGWRSARCVFGITLFNLCKTRQDLSKGNILVRIRYDFDSDPCFMSTSKSMHKK